MPGYLEVQDPLFIAPSLGFMFPITTAYLDLEGQLITREVWISWDIDELTSRCGLSGRKRVVEEYVLNEDRRDYYRQLFERREQAQGFYVPWVLGPLGLLPVVGTYISIAASTMDGISRLVDYGHENYGLVDLEALIVVIATGGKFLRTFHYENDINHGPLLCIMEFYSVMVGQDPRCYCIRTCKVAIRLEGSSCHRRTCRPIHDTPPRDLIPPSNIRMPDPSGVL